MLMPIASLRCIVAAALVLASHAHAQLTPQRAYYGINRAIPMTVAIPAGTTEAGEVRIDLFDPSSTRSEPEATAPVLAGQVDLATLFPTLWKGPTPRVRFAQLVVAGEQVGPPVALQPLVNPPTARLVNPKSGEVWYASGEGDAGNFNWREGRIVWTTEPPVYAGLRADVDKLVRVKTTLGDIDFRLRPEHAPNTVRTFRELVSGGFYTDVIVHRIVGKLPSGLPFVFQFGDPTGTSMGGPGFAIDLEQSRMEHDFGVLSAARGTDPNTNSSQVFVALSREGTKQLDGAYTAFGEAVSGADAMLAIARVESRNGRPNDPPVVTSAELIDAPPYGKRPPRVVRPVESPAAR
jgi:peptidyl-prolyl cis-trans isomerase B (cyclophilin B)